jgi:hypothetical protein
MKEVSNQEIRAIEDRELRELVRYEKLIAWGRSGALRKAAEAYYAQIAQAEKAKAVAKLRVAQIEVIETTTAKWDARAVRNAIAVENAARQQAATVERQAIQEAVDEVLALEKIVPEKDIEDILSQLSAALDIELPTSADRADICQRGPKTMEDLKRELGPSLATFFTNPVESTQKAADEYKVAQELIDDVRRTAMLQGMMIDEATSQKFEDAGATRQTAEDKLTAFIKELIDRVNFPLGKVEWVEPKRGEVMPIQEVHATIAALHDEPPTTSRCSPPTVEWLMDKIDVFDSDTVDWLDRYHPEPEHVDAETLEIGKGVLCEPYDAGLTLEQIRSISSSSKPPDQPRTPMTREEALVMMAT